jgi:DNA-binding NtrC family response regulator
MPLPSLDTTAPAADMTTDARGQLPKLALVLIDSKKEPWRIGQIAFFDALTTRLIGRGGEKMEEYASFDWQRPGDPPPVPLGISGCLAGDSLSRRQSVVTASAVDLEIVNVGGCKMAVDGKEVTRATLRPGGTFILVGEAVFLCVGRAPVLDVLRHARVAHPFGERDAAGIVGEGPEAWRIRDEATRLGEGTDFVLILGESGTGKTAVSRLIHQASSRARGPFVLRNSLNLSEGLLEAQLFGKIANFPNPGAAVEGIFPAAEGGTLFLDEIGRLSKDAQGSLLSALDNGGYQRLGESTPRRIDVRFVGATNLDKSALQGDFQYRFAEELRIAPLRERREDIPLLVRELLRRRLAKNASLLRLFSRGPGGLLYPRISGRLIDFLVHHELNGNTRELDGLIAAAVGRSHEDRVVMFSSKGGASPSIRPASTAPVSQPPSSAPVSQPPSTERDADDGKPPVTKEALVAALGKAKGNISRAAKVLGVQRSKLYRIKREFGIEEPEEEEEKDEE